MNQSKPGKLVILCSGFGLGFYIPGLMLSHTLRCLGVATDVEVFESLMTASKVNMVEKNREAYHLNFRVALASQRIPIDVRESLDAQAVDALLARWKDDDCRNFVALSGHWVYILEQYQQMRADAQLQVDLLYLDADLAPSWRQLRKFNPDYATKFNVVNLYDYDKRKVEYCISVAGDEIVPYTGRSGRLVLHGGGWGIGTYRERIPDLEKAGYRLDLVCHDVSYGPILQGGHRYYMDDLQWRTWHRNENDELIFPPFGQIPATGASVDFVAQNAHSGVYSVIREAAAIVSKPGAGTLIDSFNSATPLIMLEPFGKHESANATVWESLGFGIKFQDWAAKGYRLSELEAMHHRILDHKAEVNDYAHARFRNVLT